MYPCTLGTSEFAELAESTKYLAKNVMPVLSAWRGVSAMDKIIVDDGKRIKYLNSWPNSKAYLQCTLKVSVSTLHRFKHNLFHYAERSGSFEVEF